MVAPPILYFAARKHGIAYLQVPKVASTSLRTAICLLNHPSLDRTEISEPSWIHRNRQWNDMLPMESSELQSLFKFTFVRHPFSRFLSFYFNKLSHPNSPGREKFEALGFTSDMTLEAALDLVEATPATKLDPHLAPQSMLVYRENMLLADFVGHIEELSEGVDYIEKRAGVSLGIPRLNQTGGITLESARRQLTPHAQSRLARIYEEDFANFGYEC